MEARDEKARGALDLLHCVQIFERETRAGRRRNEFISVISMSAGVVVNQELEDGSKSMTIPAVVSLVAQNVSVPKPRAIRGLTLPSVQHFFTAFYNITLAKMPPIAREKQEEGSSFPRYVEYYYRLARDFALGVHPLSKYAVPLLLLVDALLTSLIISKVAC